MFSFGKEQKIFDIGNIKVGGQPGQTSTLLLGTIFFGKKYDNLDKEIKLKLENYIERQDELSSITHMNAAIDVFIGKKEQIEERLSFVLDRTKNPITIDIPESEVRISALKYLDEGGSLNKVIYNSINLGITKDEIEALKEHKPESAIVLGYNPKDFSTDGRIDIIETGSGFIDNGLLETANDVGIEKILIDTAATPFGSGGGETLRAIVVAKQKWGYPVGCSIHNTVESWVWMKKYKKEHPQAYVNTEIGVNGLVSLLGGDFVLYGPIDLCENIFPYMAAVDKLIFEGANDYFGGENIGNHPGSALE